LDNPSQEDIAQDAAEDILEERLLNIHEDILEKINNALNRIKDKTYGRCIECGAEIKEEDLAKEPWAEHCEVCRGE
jgi:DnaK suppressor protein